MSVSGKSDLSTLLQEQLRIIEEKTNINPKLVLGVLGAALAFVFIGYFEVHITNIIGILYPAYWSIKAIESKETDDDKQWLTYWTVFSLFIILELFCGVFLRFIPFYFFIKLAFLIWLFMPNTQGAVFVYNNFLRKLFKQYEKDLDEINNKFTGSVNNAVKDGTEFIRDNQGKIIQGAINTSQKVNEVLNRKEN